MEWSPTGRSPGANYHFMVSAVAPRPIAWITTRSAAGVVNLAPFSWFQAVCADPPTVMVSFGDREDGLKDTCRNILETGEFTISAVVEDLAGPMVDTSARFPSDVSEAEALGIALVPAVAVGPPRVAASPFHLECRLVDHRRFGKGKPTTVVFGEVVHIHARDDVLDERGNIDHGLPLLARLGGRRYVAVHRTVEMDPPALP